MPDRLHWNTVKPLSLQLGHRMSDDIDLFTDHDYGLLDFAQLDKFLRQTFAYVSDLTPGSVGMGVSYLVGQAEEESLTRFVLH